ncbi:MAG: GtrA family protein [Synechococcaceae cyanobacterium]|jgi:putative flippase GtrA
MRSRLLRFSLVGILSTLLHGLCLVLLGTITSLPGGVANGLSFVIAFCFSIQAQQYFTFRDRLGDQQLNSTAIVVLFGINASLAVGLEALAVGFWRLLLPLVPAAVNYCMLYLLSGLPRFRR